MTHNFIDDPLIDTGGRQSGTKRMAANVKSSQFIPFTALNCLLEMPMTFVLGKREDYRALPPLRASQPVLSLPRPVVSSKPGRPDPLLAPCHRFGPGEEEIAAGVDR